MREPATFETERLFLRPTSEDDAELILQLMNTPKWLEFIGDRKIRSIDDALMYIRNKIQIEFKKDGFSNYTMIRKSDQAKVGSCGLFNREGVEGVDLGFALLPAYEKQGYAYEGAQKMVEIAHTEFRFTRIKAITAKNNSASQRILEKLGMHFKSYVTLPGEHEEIMLYEIALS